MNDGRLAELMAMQSLTKSGYEIYTPLGVSGSCDFIAVKPDETLKVEVKSTESKVGEIDLRRQRLSKSGTRDKFISSKSDITVLINLNTGAIKIVASSELEGRRSIRVR